MAEKTKLGQLIVQALAASPGMNDVDCATACIAGIEPNETWHAFLTRTRKILVADYGYEKVNPGSGGEPNQDAVVPPGLGVNGKLNADSSALAVLAGARLSLAAGATPMSEQRRQEVVREFEGRRSPPPATMPREVMLSINNPRGITEERRRQIVREFEGGRSTSGSNAMLAVAGAGKPKMSETRRRAIADELGGPGLRPRVEDDQDELDAELAKLDGSARTEQPNPAGPMQLPDLLRDQLNGTPRAQLEKLLTRAGKVKSLGTSGEQLRKTIYELTDKLKNKDYRPAKEEMYSLLRSMRACERSPNADRGRALVEA